MTFGEFGVHVSHCAMRLIQANGHVSIERYVWSLLPRQNKAQQHDC